MIIVVLSEFAGSARLADINNRIMHKTKTIPTDETGHSLFRIIVILSHNEIKILFFVSMYSLHPVSFITSGSSAGVVLVDPRYIAPSVRKTPSNVTQVNGSLKIRISQINAPAGCNNKIRPTFIGTVKGHQGNNLADYHIPKQIHPGSYIRDSNCIP